MADTRIQLKVEDWVRREWMPEQYGRKFSRERVALTSGGVFDFDAVSHDGTVVANISTSGSKTRTGNHAVGKMLKVRSDVYFLLLAKADRKLVLLTELDMHEQWLREADRGRVPDSIEFVHVKLPETLDAELRTARGRASAEVSPR